MKRSLLIALACVGLYTGKAWAQLMPFDPATLVSRAKRDAVAETRATQPKVDFDFALSGNTLSLVNQSGLQHAQAFWAVNWGEFSAFDRNAWTLSLPHGTWHNITLILLDSAGRWLADTYQNVYIGDPSATHLLDVAYGWHQGQPGTLTVRPQVVLTDASRLDNYDSALPTYTYTVDFGDGTLPVVTDEVQPAVPHTYTCPGTYEMKVTAQGDNGHCFVTHTETVQVTEVSSPLQAAFSVRQVGARLQLFSDARNAGGETMWMLSDGRVFYGQNVEANVLTTGPLTVTQTVYAGQCQSTTSQTLQIHRLDEQTSPGLAQPATPASASDEIALPAFQVRPAYPNPAQTDLHVPIAGLTPGASVSVSVTDLTGRQLLAPQTATLDANGEIALDVHQLAAGIVVLTVQADGQKAVCQMVSVLH